MNREWANLTRRLLLPYAALLAGVVSPRLMGLSMLDWYTSLSLGIPLAAGLIMVFALVRMSQGPALPTSRAFGMFTVIESGAEELSWAFLRAAFWEGIAATSLVLTLPAYWATWLAALVALPDLLLQNRGATARIVRIGLLAASSVVFIYTRNFWLCWILHATVALMFARRGTAADASA